MKKSLIIIAALLIVAGIVVFVGAFALSGFDFSRLSAEKYETKVYAISEAFDNIEINGMETDIFLKPSQDGKASAVCGERDKLGYDVYVENATLFIIAKDKREWYEHVGVFNKTLAVTLYLPEERYKTLKIDGRTGDIEVPGDFSFAEMSIETSTGDIVCEASALGDITAKATTGSITASKLTAKNLSLSVDTGRVSASAISCEAALSVRVSTGRATLEDLSCAELRSEGSTGNVALENVIASDSFDIERSTGNVSFRSCDAGEIRVKTSTGDVTGTLLTEKVFITKTSTGSVNVPDSISGGRCEITTSTGDIDISLARE
jgi:hypothetical protein